jgi:hypothetical protein
VTAVKTAFTDTVLFKDVKCIVMHRIMIFRSTTDHIYVSDKNFLETLYKIVVEENYLPAQIFNMEETPLFWKCMPEGNLIHREAKSMPGYTVCVSTLYESGTKTKSPDDTFLRMYPCR